MRPLDGGRERTVACRADEGVAGASPWIARFAPLAPPGPVLDLACGAGRHVRLFRSLGHAVTAVDRDLSALADLLADPLVEPLAADLETGAALPFAGRTYAAVVVTNYLHRPLLRPLVEAVGPGGLLLYETFAAGNERFGRPSNPAFLLRPGELLEAVRGHLHVLAYEDVVVDRPRPAAVQRIAAQRVPSRAP